MAEPNENSNTTDATPNVAAQAPIIQMSATDLQDAVKAIIAQVALRSSRTKVVWSFRFPPIS